jgi:hypothetical protein
VYSLKYLSIVCRSKWPLFQAIFSFFFQNWTKQS